MIANLVAFAPAPPSVGIYPTPVTVSDQFAAQLQLKRGAKGWMVAASRLQAVTAEYERHSLKRVSQLAHGDDSVEQAIIKTLPIRGEYKDGSPRGQFCPLHTYDLYSSLDYAEKRVEIMAQADILRRESSDRWEQQQKRMADDNARREAAGDELVAAFGEEWRRYDHMRAIGWGASVPLTDFKAEIDAQKAEHARQVEERETLKRQADEKRHAIIRAAKAVSSKAQPPSKNKLEYLADLMLEKGLTSADLQKAFVETPLSSGQGSYQIDRLLSGKPLKAKPIEEDQPAVMMLKQEIAAFHKRYKPKTGMQRLVIGSVAGTISAGLLTLNASDDGTYYEINARVAGGETALSDGYGFTGDPLYWLTWFSNQRQEA